METVKGLLQVVLQSVCPRPSSTPGHSLVMEEVYRSVGVWRPKGIKRAIKGI
jgi:hypothetical protein